MICKNDLSSLFSLFHSPLFIMNDECFLPAAAGCCNKITMDVVTTVDEKRGEGEEGRTRGGTEREVRWI